MSFVLFGLTVLAGFYLLRGFRRNWLLQFWLVMASVVFYAWIGKQALMVMMALLALNFVFGRRLLAAPSRFEFAFFITINVGVLLLFKGAFSIPGVSSWMIPIGLSFLTFQHVTYLTECYRRQIDSVSWLPFCLYMLFFAKVLSGPIVRCREFTEQINSPDFYSIDFAKLNGGLLLVCIGIVKKVVFANSLHGYLEPLAGSLNSISAVEAWGFALANLLYVYFDFSGYIDIALGIALMLNIRLPQNFNSPLRSRNIQEFWRRWHMTLREFWVTHVYIPLGGSRRGIWHTLFVVWVTFLLSGYWHGHSVQYLIYGAIYAGFFTVFLSWRLLKISLPTGLAWGLTLVAPMIGTLFITADSTQQGLAAIYTMATGGWPTLGDVWHHKELWGVTTLALGVTLLPKNANALAADFKPGWRMASLMLLLVGLGAFYHLYVNNQVAFVYFRY